MKYPDLSYGKLNYTAIAFAKLKYLPFELRVILRESGRWEDIVAWAAVAAVESLQLKESFRLAGNRANRYIYLALKAEGFHRQSKKHGPAMQYQRKEIPVAYVVARLDDFE